MNCRNNLLAWEAVVITARTGNISRTAELMQTDLPRVSRWISGLEEELGARLFDRSRRPFAPTQRSSELVRQAEPLVRGFRQMIEERSQAPARRRVLRFAAPH